MVDLGPIPGTLHVMWEYTLDVTPVHCRASHKHLFTPRGNLELNLKETYMDNHAIVI